MQYMNKMAASQDQLIPSDFHYVIDAELHDKGLVNHHIESFNTLCHIGLRQIITTLFKVDLIIKDEAARRLFRGSDPREQNIDYIHFEVIFTDLNMTKPVNINPRTKVEEIMTPLMAIQRDLTYKGSIYIDAKIRATAHFTNGAAPIVREDKVENKLLSRIPIMVGSDFCSLHGLPREAKLRLGEDPDDLGGYFILNGHERVVDCVDNSAYNIPRIFKNNYEKERMRCEMISKSGDYFENSDQFIVRWSKTGHITVEISRNHILRIAVPFYMMFRLLGWVDDKTIMDHILNEDYTSDLSMYMIQILKTAFLLEYKDKNSIPGAFEVHDRKTLIDLYAQKSLHLYPDAWKNLNIQQTKDNIRIIHEHIETRLNENFLAHIGTTPAHHHHKARYLAAIIRNILLCNKGIVQTTDRDSYNTKRVLAAGNSLSKVVKNLFNNTAINQIRRRAFDEFSAVSFFNVNLANIVNASIQGSELEKAMTNVIKSGHKSSIKISHNKRYTNRISAQALHRKNIVHTISLCRTISESGGAATSAKQSERAIEMRVQHPSFIGYICLAQMPVGGEKVGLTKQCACTMSITKAYSGDVIRQLLLEDKEQDPQLRMYHYDSVTPREIYENRYICVNVNGAPLGFCAAPFKFIARYRRLRRQGKIPREIEIVWSNQYNEIQFLTDSDRPIRPLIIVYNTERDPQEWPLVIKRKADKWTQDIGLTKEHINLISKREMGMKDLCDMQIVEYIGASEQFNCLLSPDYENLKALRHNPLYEYTHCDIPIAIYGLTAMSQPFANKNEVTRLFYQSSQVNQAMHIPSFNWAERTNDKEVAVQYRSSAPLVKTLQNRYVPSCGHNAVVAIMCYSGYNVEDSQIFSKASIERGFFNGCKITNYATEFDNHEEFKIPHPDFVEDVKSDYSKLADGLARERAVLREGHPIIAKVLKVPRDPTELKDPNAREKKDYIDKSIIYKDRDPAIVHRSMFYITNQDNSDKNVAKVVVRKPRPVSIGDKFSSRSGQKGVVSALLQQSMLPFNEQGLTPQIILNPHSFPSRMTIGQVDEGVLAKLCAIRGLPADGTSFTQPDMKAINAALESHGYMRDGHERMYSMNGNAIDYTISCTINQYQRLQKFPDDQENTVSIGPTDALSMQPLDGKAAHGGIRCGEMERDGLAAHGSVKVMYEKFSNHSDGYVDHFCRNCGLRIIYNPDLKLYHCSECWDKCHPVAINSCWSAKMVHQENECSGIGARQYPAPFTYPRVDKQLSDLIKPIPRDSRQTLPTIAE